MSKLVGIIPDMLGVRKIYDNDPKLFQIMGNANFIVVHDPDPSGAGATWNRCDYCGRTNNKGNDCLSCGAPL